MHRWLKIADAQDGVVPGVTKEESTKVRGAKKSIHLLEHVAEVMRRALAYLSREIDPK